MCTSLNYPHPIPSEVFTDAAKRILKRSDRFSDLCGFRYKWTPSAPIAMGANERAGFTLRVPKGELWKPQEVLVSVKWSAATVVQQAEGELVNCIEQCENGLWDGTTEDYERKILAFTSGSSATTHNFKWYRESADIRYRQIDEDQFWYVFWKVDAAGGTMEYAYLDIIYYRTLLWDEILRKLRQDFRFTEAEMVKAMSAMGVSVFSPIGCDAGNW